MRRIRWFAPDDPSTPIEWRAAAAVLATLFLNLYFWLAIGDRFWMQHRLPIHAALTLAITVLTVMVAACPAIAARNGGRSLHELFQHSVGSHPAYIVRWICVGFGFVWAAALVSLPVRLWVNSAGARPWQEFALSAALTAFLFYTGLQSWGNAGKLSFFTSKLGLALFLAALWRVRDGWSAIPGGFQDSAGQSPAGAIWPGFTELAVFLVPFGLLAADVAARLRSRTAAVLATAAGVVVPLFASLLLCGIIGVATHRSYIYQPSLNPSVGMALFGRTASSAVTGRYMVASITVFGAARFCIWSMSNIAPISTPKGKRVVVPLLCLGTAWLAMHAFAPAFESAIRFFSNCLAVMSGIITADWLIRRRPSSRRIDWIGCAAFVIGLAVPWRLPHESWEPLVLRCYGVAFIACLAGRALERALDRQLLQLLHRD